MPSSFMSYQYVLVWDELEKQEQSFVVNAPSALALCDAIRATVGEKVRIRHRMIFGEPAQEILSVFDYVFKEQKRQTLTSPPSAVLEASEIFVEEGHKIIETISAPTEGLVTSLLQSERIPRALRRASDPNVTEDISLRIPDTKRMIMYSLHKGMRERLLEQLPEL